MLGAWLAVRERDKEEGWGEGERGRGSELHSKPGTEVKTCSFTWKSKTQGCDPQQG